MAIETWLATFDEVVDGSSLRNAAARAVAEFMRRYGGRIGAFVDARRSGEHELVILDLLTGAPQRAAYPILQTERVGILFLQDAQPLVVMLRDDFPDTEHQQLVPEGFPATICIDDRPWIEARLTWTPAELIERVLSWFRRAGRGELHDARQPLDPVFASTNLKFLIARSVLDSSRAQNLIAEYDQDDRTTLRVKPIIAGRQAPVHEPLCLVTYRVEPVQMKRLKFLPENLAALSNMLAERGINLIDDLKKLFGEWFSEGPSAAWRLNARFALIIEMPIVSPRGQRQEGLDHRAFVTPESAGDIAIALGIAEKPPIGVGKIGYARVIGVVETDVTAIAKVIIQAAEVHLEFEQDLAARLVGRAAPDTRKVVLVGAGAIGSHVIDYLIREGRFAWTIIDDDRLLPHNLARHTARNDRVAQPKARILMDLVNGTLVGAPCAAAIEANLFASGEAGVSIAKALAEANLIIDASASVVAGRHLSDHKAEGRRVSVFFNPAGEATVLLAEPSDRSLTLRDLEAQYLSLVLRSDGLTEHLGKDAVTVAYTGACRAITNRIPAARAAVLSGLAASGLTNAVDADAAVITIWSLAPDGGVTVASASPEPVVRFRAGEWEIAVDAGLMRRIYEMRGARAPSETGGVLFGLVDIPAQRIHLVDASPAPPDSAETTVSFVRGVEGVEELMDRVRQVTAGQVRYVGEWHSHPPRTSARPSAVDGQQIDWLAALMGMDSMPALMVIAAEKEFAVILANQQAEKFPERSAA
jgi:hypothetical protein